MGVSLTPALAGAFCQSDGVIDGRKRRFDLARFCLTNLTPATIKDVPPPPVKAAVVFFWPKARIWASAPTMMISQWPRA
jgi:hypothetical protein